MADTSVQKKMRLRYAKRRIEALNFLSNISLDGSNPSSQSSDRAQGQNGKIGSDIGDQGIGARSIDNPRGERDTDINSLVTGAAQAAGNARSLVDTPSGSIQCNRVRTRTRRISGGEKSPPAQSPFYHSSSFTGSVGTHGEHSKRRLFHHQLSGDFSGSLTQVTEGAMCMLPSAHATCRLESPKEKSPTGAVQRLPVSRSFHQLRHSKNERMLLVTPRHSPFVMYSLLPYTRRSQLGIYRRNSDAAAAFARSRRTSGNKPLKVQSEDCLAMLDGVDLGEEGAVVSFSHFLVPTRDTSLVMYRKHLQDLEQLAASPHSPAIRKMTLTNVSPLQWEKSELDGHPLDLTSHASCIYDPMTLDDPGLSLGKHRKLLTFSSYMVSIVDYTKPSELKKDLNHKFRERFPNIDLTLSKLRSLKQEMKKVVLDVCSLDPWILAVSYVYFEKLVLHRKINKENRKSCAGTSLLLAAKLNDIKGADLQNLFKEVESTFRESRKTLIAFEFPILVALEFSLHLPDHEVMPHFKRIILQS